MDGKPSHFYDDFLTQIAMIQGLARTAQSVKTIAWQIVKTKFPVALQPSIRLVVQNKEYPVTTD